MKTSRIFSAIGTLALVAAPVAAHANTRAADAQAVSVQPAMMSDVTRASETAKSESELFGGTSVILAIAALAAVIIGIIIAVDDDEDVSPGT